MDLKDIGYIDLQQRPATTENQQKKKSKRLKPLIRKEDVHCLELTLLPMLHSSWGSRSGPRIQAQQTHSG